MKPIAVVILNWNGAEMMRRFLPSVVAFSSEDAEIIVADNASDDDSCEMLEQEFPSVKILRLDRNHGFAEGYNQALAQLPHPYFLLLNSDVEVTDGWLLPLLAYMEEHPEAAACQPKVLSQKHKALFEYAGAAGGFIDRYGYPFCRGRVFGDVEADSGQYDTEQTIFWATGAALLIRSEDWRNAGGLDGRFFAHMEEIDLCWRLRARGRSIVCLPDSRVYHVGGGTLDKKNPRKTFLNFRNNLLMLYKNLPEAELRTVMRRRAWLDRIAALKFLLSGSLAEAKAVFRARREFRRMLPDFEADRRENLSKATGNRIPERLDRSLLIQYYLKGKKTFAALRPLFGIGI